MVTAPSMIHGGINPTIEAGVPPTLDTMAVPDLEGQRVSGANNNTQR